MMLTNLIPGSVRIRIVPEFALALLLPALSHAQMECRDCHDLHDAAGGTLNTAAEFDLICDTCHGPSGTAIFTDRHVDPTVNLSSGNTGKPAWEMGCITCHTPHPTDTVNHLYDNGATHAHTIGGAAANPGGTGDGNNIKLLGRNEDGTGIAKFATPLRIIQVADGPCTASDVEVEIYLPPFVAGDGPPATIMIGDRIVINNGGSAFDGSFRVKETDWNGITNTPPTGWVCFDRETAATYEPTGFVRSKGWHQRPRIRRVDWGSDTATLSLNDGYSIRVGDSINVSGLPENTAGTFNGVKTVTAVTNTEITTASWVAGTATLTLAETHLYQAGERIEVSGVISAGPGSFNGQFIVAGASGPDVSYALATDPGAYSSSGTIATPVQSRVAYTLPVGQGSGSTSFSSPNPRLEYMGSSKLVNNMVAVAPPGPAPYVVTDLAFTAGRRPDRDDSVLLTLDRTHGYLNGQSFTVTGIDPPDYDGTWVVESGEGTNQIEYLNLWDPDPPAYVSGGEIPDAAAPTPVIEITLTNGDADINQFQPATTGLRDGDIITVYGAVPEAFNRRWEVESVALPVITVRCPPFFRTVAKDASLPQDLPACTTIGLPTYVSGGEIQSTGTLRPVVFESRGTDNNDPDFLSDHTHSFANTDQDLDGWMDGACETCHTQTANHLNDDFGNTHNNGRTCTASCHTHSTGFDKANEYCPPGRTCPPVN